MELQALGDLVLLGPSGTMVLSGPSGLDSGSRGLRSSRPRACVRVISIKPTFYAATGIARRQPPAYCSYLCICVARYRACSYVIAVMSYVRHVHLPGFLSGAGPCLGVWSS
jgi:hypothetical protein